MSANFSENIENMLNSHGYTSNGYKTAHSKEINHIVTPGSSRLLRVERESRQELFLTKFATRAIGSGNRLRVEEADPYRTCFEKDLDKIKHASSFRRLAGKCQVFLNPNNDMIRTRLTHSIEVAQIAKSVSNYLGANSDLVEAIALAHDCGHGPGGHASEDAFSSFLPEGFDHAVWGAEVALTNLNLCIETLDGVRNHSWKRPTTSTPEASIVSWADRIAYVCHDFNDARNEGLVSDSELEELFTTIGFTQSEQIDFFINALVRGSLSSGYISMKSSEAEMLETFRDFNYRNIYLSPKSMSNYNKIVKMLSSLVDFYAENPSKILEINKGITEEAKDEVFNSVKFIASMTDRFAIKLAIENLGFPESELPKIIY